MVSLGLSRRRFRGASRLLQAMEIDCSNGLGRGTLLKVTVLRKSALAQTNEFTGGLE
jgi:hypothetical protein